MKHLPLPGLVPTLAAGLLLAPGVFAQRADRLVRSDLEFARGLAADYRYTDLAEDVLAEVESAGLSEGLTESLALAKCEVFSDGARYEGDPERRVELYDKSVKAYREFLDEYPFSPLLDEAELAYVDLANRYGRVLEQALDDAVGEEAAALREKLEDVLKDALDRTRDLIDNLQAIEEKTVAQENELYRLQLNRGQMLLTLAKVAAEGTFYFSQAESTLEELALEAGETSAAGLQAYAMLAKVKIEQGEYLDASDFSSFVIDLAVPSSAELRAGEDWRNLPFEVKSKRWQLVELAMPDLLTALGNAGETADATGWALYYYNVWKSEGFNLSPLGYLSLLSVARALLDGGGYVGGTKADGDLQWFETEAEMKSAGFTSSRNSHTALDLALSIAQTVNEDNRGSTLQIRAQKLIADVIDRPGVVVSPDVLYEAAEGEFFANNYVEALDAFKRILRVLDRQDEATRQEYMPKVLFRIGGSLERMERDLEAAMAYREATVSWQGDPEYQEKNANGFHRSIRKVRAGAQGVTEIQALVLEAENAVTEAATAGGVGNIVWAQAEREYSDKNYTEARQRYLDVQPGEDVYEKAVAKAALCEYKDGDKDAAQKAWIDYLTVYVPDPANAINTPKKLESRAAARAMATFYLGRIAYDEQNWEEMNRYLEGFADEFPGQDSYAVNAMYMVIKGHLSQKQYDEAKAVHDDMVQRFPEESRTGHAAQAIYQYLAAERDAAEQAGNDALVFDLSEKMASYLKLSNSLSRSPAFGNLRNESLHWIEVENWTEAERVLRQAVEAYGDDPEEADKVEQHVLPDLGLALLEQHELPEAFAVLDPLVGDEGRPSAETTERWCLAVCGWVEGDETNVVEVPGVGDEAQLEQAAIYWNQLAQREALSDEGGGKWECRWYELKFLGAYGNYRWGQLDSKKLEVARDTIARLRVDLEDPSLMGIAEKCGDHVLRKRFLWLWEKVQ